MGLSERDELDNLRGVPLIDLFELPPACPHCRESLTSEDLEYDTCRVCGESIREVP